MSEETKQSRIARMVRKAATDLKVAGNHDSLISRVHNRLSKVLGQTSVIRTANGLGLENLDTQVRRNAAFDVEKSFPVNDLVAAFKELGVPESKIEALTYDALRVLDGECSAKSIVRDMPTGRYSDVVGRSAARDVGNTDLGVEAWGEDIDTVPSDERVTLDIMTMRQFTSLTDKGFARVPYADNLISVRVPNPMVYDWLRTQSGLAIDRGPDNNIQLRDLYRDASTVNSEPQRMIPQPSQDTNRVLWNNTTLLTVGKSADMINLCMVANKFGYDHVDRSDLICKGGRIAGVVLSLSNGSTTEYFRLDTETFRRADYVPNPTGSDSGDNQCIMPCFFLITKGDVQYNGTASTLAASFTDTTVRIRVDLSSTLSLKYGRINSSATTDITVLPNTKGGTVSEDEQRAAHALTATVAAFDPKLFFDEENFRKSNLAIWVNYNQNQFVIPRSRNYFTEYAFDQKIDENAVQATGSIMTLGNSHRAIGILANALNDVATMVTYANRNAACAKANDLDESSMVSSLVRPLVLTTVIDFSEESVGVMNESTRPNELHGRFRARAMSMLAELMAKSQMVNQYNAGEKVVFKAFAHSAIADVLLGVTEYRPDYNDKEAAASGADYSFTLPNGYRVDVIKTTFDCLIDRVIMVPVRESNPADLTSAAQIADRGTASAVYAPTNAGATVKRVVSTTREILMMTNPIGLIIQIANIDQQLGGFDSTPIPLAPNSNNYSALSGNDAADTATAGAKTTTGHTTAHV